MVRPKKQKVSAKRPLPRLWALVLERESQNFSLYPIKQEEFRDRRFKTCVYRDRNFIENLETAAYVLLKRFRPQTPYGMYFPVYISKQAVRSTIRRLLSPYINFPNPAPKSDQVTSSTTFKRGTTEGPIPTTSITPIDAESVPTTSDMSATMEPSISTTTRPGTYSDANSSCSGLSLALECAIGKSDEVAAIKLGNYSESEIIDISDSDETVPNVLCENSNDQCNCDVANVQDFNDHSEFENLDGQESNDHPECHDSDVEDSNDQRESADVPHQD